MSLSASTTGVDYGQALSRWVVFTDPGTDTWSTGIDWGDGWGATSAGLTATAFPLDHTYPSPGR